MVINKIFWITDRCLPGKCLCYKGIHIFFKNEYLSMLFAFKRITSKKQTAIMEANYEKEN
ncbi:MAG: hypothetical protein DRH93_12245 [Deltaproteobacteria bacterium]|nr:MAG: hypothetical protein DRH93_12245 [Deltaproteobacteria bacterium]